MWAWHAPRTSANRVDVPLADRPAAPGEFHDGAIPVAGAWEVARACAVAVALPAGGQPPVLCQPPGAVPHEKWAVAGFCRGPLVPSVIFRGARTHVLNGGGMIATPFLPKAIAAQSLIAATLVACPLSPWAGAQRAGAVLSSRQGGGR
jgi:hypothetical protein